MTHGGNVWQGSGPEAWLDFSANLRPEGPPDWVTRTVTQSLSRMRYYPDLSMREARRGLAAYAGVEENCILPMAGGIAAIDLALRLKNGPVCVQKNTFGEYARRAALLGRDVVPEKDREEVGGSERLCDSINLAGSA